MAELIIVQPWFTAVGHPAQSLLNTANALRGVDGLRYLVSLEDRKPSPQCDTLRSIAHVDDFRVNGPSLREGTLKALFKLLNLKRKERGVSHIFFFDAHLVLLAGLWRCFYSRLLPRRLSLIYLKGPERIQHSFIANRLVSRFLGRQEVTLYLRTEELVQAWRTAFPAAPSTSIRYLPSLELPGNDAAIEAPVPDSMLRFGILGQVRHGKGLEWLVPMFQNSPKLGMLTVAGTFNNAQDAESMYFLQGFAGFRNEFLSDDDMLAVAREQHFLLMLYDQWDERMESAVLYLAARAGRPVIAYDNGWCGRQVKTYGNGLLVHRDHDALPSLIASLPRPGSDGYAALLKGVERFRHAHSVDHLREPYLQELMN
jgi:glycosyltransferase involved in cell wall biosynthesis